MTKKNKQMAVSVVGGGAVGRVLAALVVRQGIACQVVSRSEGVLSACEVDLGDGSQTYALQAIAHPTLWFFTTKAYDLEAAIRQWRPVSPAIVFCNGDVSEVMARVSAQGTWRRGVVTFGVRETTRGFALIGSSGQAVWGGGTCTGEEHALLGLESRFAWSDDIESLWREKWLLNVVINTLTAGMGLARNGEVLQSHGDLLRKCAEEALRFALDRWKDFRQKLPDLLARLESVLRDTADNENSMARDLRLGKRTESAYLAGLMQDEKEYPCLTHLAALIADREGR